MRREGVEGTSTKDILAMLFLAVAVWMWAPVVVPIRIADDTLAGYEHWLATLDVQK